MKKALLLFCILAISTGCATEVKKRFTVIVEPPDADITVVPAADLPVQKYHSPAEITVSLPKDPDLASKSRMEIKRDAYKPKTIGLGNIEEGETLRVRLDKIVHYRLTYRMLGPVQSDILRYRDKVVDVSITPGDHRFSLSITNLSQKPLKILWQQAQYIDYQNRQHRVVHSGIKPQDRNSLIPPQEIPAGGKLEQDFVPVSAIFYSPEKRSYDTRPLFPVDSDLALALKGRTFSIFLPLEIDRAIIPDYSFRFQVVEAIKEQ
jgi:hypothetical protein